MPEDYPVTELWQVINGEVQGRTSASQITLFDGVGFAIEDFSALKYVYQRALKTGHFQQLDMIADPDDPRDLFGMLTRATEPA
jgi:ornithine cyclodeaminase